MSLGDQLEKARYGAPVPSRSLMSDAVQTEGQQSVFGSISERLAHTAERIGSINAEASEIAERVFGPYPVNAASAAPKQDPRSLPAVDRVQVQLSDICDLLNALDTNIGRLRSLA